MRSLRLRPPDIIKAAAVIGGLALIVIGVRFLIVPGAAAWFFGFGAEPGSHEFHYAIALRDVWLGVLLLALAWGEQWRAIALWFGLAAPVCLGDALIAWTASGRIGSVAFHLASGVASAIIAAIAWREGERRAD